MDRRFEETLHSLTNFNYKESTVTLWVVFRRLRNRKAIYTAKSIDIGDELAEKLNLILKDKVKDSNQVAPYEYISTDQDETVLGIDSEETDFNRILEQIESGADQPKIQEFEEIVDAWAYVIKLQYHGEKILGFKRVKTKSELKKANFFVNAVFRDKKFVDIKEEEIFKISKQIDFYYYQDLLFILNKKEFETGLNFREGMIRKRDEVLEEFQEAEVVNNIELIREKVGNNLNYLRKLATIKNNGYFKHENFLERLRQVNRSEQWGLEFDDGTIAVDENNIDLVLTVLNKDRLKDLIEGETFDVSVKKSVNGSAEN